MTQYTRHTKLFPLLLSGLVTLLLIQVAGEGRGEQPNLSAPGMAVALFDSEQQGPADLEPDEHYLPSIPQSLARPFVAYLPKQKPVASASTRLIVLPPSRASPIAS